MKLAELGACRSVRLEQGPTYCNFEVHHFLSERAHFVVEAKAVLSGRLGREYRV